MGEYCRDGIRIGKRGLKIFVVVGHVPAEISLLMNYFVAKPWKS